MQITTFSVDIPNNHIDLVITDAATATSITIWTEDTYRNVATGIDLSSKLTGAATENIEITPSDVSQSSFQGVFFVEVGSPTEIASEVTSELTVYKECLLERSLINTEYSDCLSQKNVDFITAQALLVNLENAIELKFTDEIITIIASLKKYCNTDCVNCGERSNIAQL